MELRQDCHSSPGVLPAPPRDVFRKRGVPVPMRCLLFLLIPHVWAGLFIIGLVLWRPLFELFGTQTTATVVSRKIEHSKKSSSCRVVYAYEEDGPPYQDTASFDSSAFDQFPPGSSLLVRTLHFHGHGSSRPLTSEPASDPYWGLVVFAMVWDGVVLLLFYGICLSPLRERKLLRDGQIAGGQITETTIQRGKSTSYLLTYAFQTTEGETISRKATVRRQDYDAANVGDMAIVFYAPLHPRRSVLYNYSQYSVRGMEL